MVILAHNPKYIFEGRDDQKTDAIVVREIWCENVYELHDGDLADTRIVVDIGANIGAFGLYAMSLMPNVKVYSIEPEQNNFNLMVRNASNNDLNGGTFKSCSLAIGDKECELHIDNNGGDSRISDSGQLVNCQTLDNFMYLYGLDYVDVLKIDVEGYEANIILPCQKLHKFRYITMEFDHDNGKQLGAIVEKLSVTHQVKVVGDVNKGGMIFARRY
jgi:FkbM family methyltransferase